MASHGFAQATPVQAGCVGAEEEMCGLLDGAVAVSSGEAGFGPKY